MMWDLSRGLNTRDVHCDMLCTAEAGKPALTIDFPGDGKCFCVRSVAKIAATMISPAMIIWLRKHCREYDIVHIHHPDPMACLALRLSGYKGKVVLHWHSDILKQKGLLKLYLPLQRWMIRRACRIVGTTPDYVAASSALADVQDKVTCLPIGIEDNIRMDGLDREGEARIIFSLGRMVEYKGFINLVEAARYLPEGYRIVVGGTGLLEDELKARCAAIDTDCRVEFPGYLTDEQARGMFNTCDVFVLPSVMKTEAFGIVQLEAMSCGKPVVATRIPGSGTAWVNAHGVSGLNVPVDDPRAIAEAVQEICSDPGRYEEFSRGARKRYEEIFTLERMIDGILEIYGSCF